MYRILVEIRFVFSKKESVIAFQQNAKSSDSVTLDQSMLEKVFYSIYI